ncbi:MAG: bifunctional nuclease family protein [Spirochaetes bacterium]|nr:bifunctional nuclease family protein [Spirochaetota bacterium]HPA71038.1 bifunctional nuclease family protein [Spirochaetota bacterium]
MTRTECKVVNIFLDKDTGAPVVLLKDLHGDDILPIVIAPLEASMIAIELEGKKPVRPLTHDLIVQLLKEFRHELKSISIHDLRNNIYFASLNLESGGTALDVDCRPSDAIAVALRTGAPIFVSRKVFALAMGPGNLAGKMDKETLREVLEDIEIDDVGGKIM